MQQLPLFADERLPFAWMRDRLLAMFGSMRDLPRDEPVSQLVRAILGQAAKDIHSGPAHDRLKAMGWEAVRRSEPEALALVISDGAPATLSRVTRPKEKARAIIAALGRIRGRDGRLSLDYLARWPAEAAVAHLDAFDGVGVKSAAATVNFSTLRLRAFVADCHVLRIGQRWSLLPAKDYERGYRTFMRALPADWDADDFFEFHWLLKRLGQTVCVHPVPACARCPLASRCPKREAVPARRRRPAPAPVMVPDRTAASRAGRR